MMARPQAIAALLRHDLTRMLRDQFLLGISVYIAGIAIAMRWIVPWLTHILQRELAFDFAPYVPLAMSYFVLINSSTLTGMVSGFLLLETREERTVHALRVAPIPEILPILVMGTTAWLAGVVLAVAMALGAGVGLPPMGALLASAALGAPTGVAICFLLASMASNKVEAFAVIKLTSLIGLVPLIGYFLPMPWQWLAGVSPPYWACRIWWDAAAGQSDWAWLMLPGIAVSAVWVGGFARHWRHQVARD